MEQFIHKLTEDFSIPFQKPVLVFSTILFIILMAPLLLRKLRVPGIVGLIISGVIIGPHGFNIIEKNAAVNLFGTIGLLYIMFIAGLDLDLREFARNRYRSLIFGFLTFAIPLGLGMPICLYVLDYSGQTSLLLSSMFATHTLVAYPIVTKLGLNKHEAVAVTVGGTILTDTAVLLLLAVITGRAQGAGSFDLWMRLGISFIVFLAVMIFVVPRISRWFFRRLEGEKNSQYIFVLSVLFFCAFLSELAGLEPIIGAFAAGLALNGIIPTTSPLMNRVEFVGNSLFIPFFLISVGMVVDVKVLLNGPQALFVAGVLTTFALFSKWLAAWITGMLLRFSYAQRSLMFGLSSSHAAATLAIILVGFEIGIVDEAILNGTVILILITCLVATLVTDIAGKKVAIMMEQAPPIKQQQIGERILVPLSNPATVEKLVDLAYAFKGMKAAYPLYGLSVVEDNDEAEFRLTQSRKTLEEAHRYVVSFGGHFEAVSTIDQNIAAGIKRVARELGATDIVMGSNDKTNLTDLIFGKMVEQVTETTSEAVWLFHPVRALNDHKRLHIVCPQYSEKEPGFVDWITKASRLAAAMNMKTTLHTTQDTFVATVATITHLKLRFPVDFSPFEDWADFLVLSREFSTGSFIMVVAPRKGSVSHMPEVEQAPRRLAKHFNTYTYLIVYPETRHGEEMRDFSREFDPTLLEIGLNQVKRSATGISKMLRGKEGKV